MHLRIAWFTSLLAVVGPAAAAQNAPRTGLRLETPTSAARAAIDSFVAAVDKERWPDAARWLDMPRFTAFFNQMVSSVRSTLPQPQSTVETLMAQDSTMPRAVAEWQLKQMRAFVDSEPFGYLSHQFAGVRTQRELFALTPTEAAARWLEAQDRRTAMRESWRRAGCKGPVPAELLAFSVRTVRGVVVADSLAYAVMSRPQSPGELDQMGEPPSVLTARRTAAGWRILPEYNLLSGGNMAVAAVSGGPGC